MKRKNETDEMLGNIFGDGAFPSVELKPAFQSVSQMSYLSPFHVGNELVLGLLGDGALPDWLFVKHAALIPRVVFVSLPSCSLFHLHRHGISGSSAVLAPVHLPEGPAAALVRYDAPSVPSSIPYFPVREMGSSRSWQLKRQGGGRSPSFPWYASVRALGAANYVNVDDLPYLALTRSLGSAFGRSAGAAQRQGSAQDASQVRRTIRALTEGEELIRRFAAMQGTEAWLEKHRLTLQQMEEVGYLLDGGAEREDAEEWVDLRQVLAAAPASAPVLLALDCEMCKTERGSELTRLSVVDAEHRVLLDMLVKPPRAIVDYLTEYSGVSAEMLEPVTATLRDAQRALCALMGRETFLVGQSIEFDLKALKVLHDRLIDTTMLFPHPRAESGSKHSLRHLAFTYLLKKIRAPEAGKQGHDPCEDAQTAMELLQVKRVSPTVMAGKDVVEAMEKESEAKSLPVALERLGVRTGICLRKGLGKAGKQGLMSMRAPSSETAEVESDDQVVEKVREWLATPAKSKIEKMKEKKDEKKTKRNRKKQKQGGEADAGEEEGEEEGEGGGEEDEVEGEGDEEKPPCHGLEFIFASLMDLDFLHRFQGDSAAAPVPGMKTPPGAVVDERSWAELDQTVQKTMERIMAMHDALQPGCLMVVASSHGPASEVLRLIQKKREMGMNWSKLDNQELLDAVMLARSSGFVFLGVKQP